MPKQPEFINRFRKGAVPENIPEVTLENNGEAMGILKLIKEAGHRLGLRRQLRRQNIRK